VDPLNWKWKNSCFSGIKRICRRVRNWFAQHSSNFFLSALLHLSQLDRCIPSHNYIKTFNWVRSPFEQLVLQVHCEVDCIAEQQLTELQRRQLWSLWLNFGWIWIQWRQISLICVGRQKQLFCFFHLLYIRLWSWYTCNYFWNQPQPEDDIRCTLTTAGSYFDKLVKQFQRQDFNWNLWMWAINQIC